MSTGSAGGNDSKVFLPFPDPPDHADQDSVVGAVLSVLTDEDRTLSTQGLTGYALDNVTGYYHDLHHTMRLVLDRASDEERSGCLSMTGDTAPQQELLTALNARAVQWLEYGKLGREEMLYRDSDDTRGMVQRTLRLIQLWNHFEMLCAGFDTLHKMGHDHMPSNATAHDISKKYQEIAELAEAAETALTDLRTFDQEHTQAIDSLDWSQINPLYCGQIDSQDWTPPDGPYQDCTQAPRHLPWIWAELVRNEEWSHSSAERWIAQIKSKTADLLRS